jgi:hypothetical protein
VITSASGTDPGSSSPGAEATLAGSSGGSGGALAFTGEPSWIDTLGRVALVLSVLCGLGAFALRRNPRIARTRA